MARIRSVTLTATFAAVLSLAACGSTGGGTGAGAGGGTNATPTPTPYDTPLSLTASGSGELHETWVISGPGCSASESYSMSFTLDKTPLTGSEQAGRFVSGPVDATGTSSGNGATSCPFSPPAFTGSGSTNAVLTLGQKSTFVILPSAAGSKTAAALGGSGIFIPTPEADGPLWSWVLSADDVTGEEGSTQCTLVLGPTPTPGAPPVSTCSIQAGSSYSGNFEAAEWPCISTAGFAAAHGFSVTCTGSGSADLDIDAVDATTNPDMKVSPTSLNFPATATGSKSATQTVTITNHSDATAPLGVFGVTVPGGNSADYTVSGITTPTVLTPGQSVTFQVAFTPHTAGNDNANLAIATNSATPLFTLALSGVGA